MKGLSLIIDINSHSIGAALVDFDGSLARSSALKLKNSSKKLPNVILNQRLSLPLGNVHPKRTDLTSYLERLLKNILQAKHQRFNEKPGHVSGSHKISEILCTASSPWCRSSVETISLKNDEAVEVKLGTIEGMLGHPHGNQLGSSHFNLKSVRDIPETSDKYEYIDRKILKVRLNGYEVSKPFGKMAKELELTVFEAKMMKQTIASLLKSFDTLIFGDVELHAFPLSSFIAVRELFDQVNNFAVVEVSGDATEVTLARDGIKATKAFSLGKNLFLYSIAKEFDVGPEIALSYLKLYYEKKTEEQFGNKLKEVIGKAERKWTEALKETFEELEISNNEEGLQVFLAMDSELENYFSEIIRKSTTNEIDKETERDGKKLNVISLNHDIFNKYCNFESGLYDPFLALQTIYYKVSKS